MRHNHRNADIKLQSGNYCGVSIELAPCYHTGNYPNAELIQAALDHYVVVHEEKMSQRANIEAMLKLASALEKKMSAS